MDKSLDPKELVTFTQEALINLLDKKGIVKKEEVIEKIKKLRKENL